MSFWKWLKDDPAPVAALRAVPLRIASHAMCCAVGHNAPAAIAAINARVNHFRETEFVDDTGNVIIGSALHNVPTWGAERLRQMLHAVIGEIFHSVTAPHADTEKTAILLLTPEAERPGMPHDTLADDLAKLKAGNVPGFGSFHESSAMYAYGKAGIARLLQEAAALLTEEEAPRHVLVAAVDSLLDAGAIEHFLGRERLATPDNADGFIPGEGAAALLLTTEPDGQAALWIEAVATAQESWCVDSDIPLRAIGLTTAIRSAVHEAGVPIKTLDFHASGMTGESWYAKEVSLAITRVLEERKPEFPHHIIASRVGETGAAAAALTLAWLSDVMGRPDNSWGTSALLHFAGDTGHRAALVVRHRQ